MTDKARETLRAYAKALTDNLPDTWDIMHAFHDADDDLNFDEDAGNNYLTGCLQGAADALGVSVAALIQDVYPEAFDVTPRLTGD